MFFFFNDTATTEIYTLSLHDALPIYHDRPEPDAARLQDRIPRRLAFRTLRLEREVDHHDPVLLHEPDEHDDADESVHAEVHPENEQRQERPECRERQCRQDGERVDEALVQDA